MSTTLTSSIDILTIASLVGSGIANPVANVRDANKVTIASAEGTFLYVDEVSTETANKTYDLIGASALLDPFGVAVDIDKIAALIIQNTHATNYLRVSSLPATLVAGTTPEIIIPPLGSFVWAAPVGVLTTANFVVTGRDDADSTTDDGTWKVIAIGKHVA